MSTSEQLYAFIAVIGAVVSVLSMLQQRKLNTANAKKTDEERMKIKAEATEIIQRISAEQLESQEKIFEEERTKYDGRIVVLEETAKELRTQVSTLQTDLAEILDCLVRCVEGAHELYDQVRRSGAEPSYTPPPYRLHP